jgi:hypothetical protein
MQSDFVCDITGGRTDSERWIDFPWELGNKEDESNE